MRKTAKTTMGPKQSKQLNPAVANHMRKASFITPDELASSFLLLWSFIFGTDFNDHLVFHYSKDQGRIPWSLL
jgi:hypothetical protein